MRRSWYERHPSAQRRLSRPVISVGNLAVGGSGKTPIVAALARMLLDEGERPAILSRGYGRRASKEGVVVVSDGQQVLVPVEESGDEPQMLARVLPGVAVLVARDRYLAGVVAESRLGASVLLLDDGFQHLQLARNIDLLVITPADLDDQVLPSGRLREPLDAARAADALLVHGGDEACERVSRELGGKPAFGLRVAFRPLEPLIGGAATDGSSANALAQRAAIDGTRPQASAGSVFAVAGIARPQRFFDALRAGGHQIAGQMTFRDHHWFTPADIARITAAAKEAGATLVVTTRKDAVRLERLIAASGLDWAVLPMDVGIQPADSFRRWIAERLAAGNATGAPQ